MNQFPSVREAKEFLVREIVVTAERQGVSISETERKMLYFSETDWTLSDMPAVAETFQKECDEYAYERKIRSVIRAAKIPRSETHATAWSDAIERLREGDHYLSVLIGPTRANRRGDRLRLVLTVLVVFVAVIAFQWGLSWYLGHEASREEGFFYVWVVAMSAAGAYVALRWIYGGRAIDGFIGRIIDKVFGSPKA